GLDVVAGVDPQRLAARNEMLAFLPGRLAVVIDLFDDDGSFALAVLAEADTATDLGHHGWIARTSCLEDLGDTRQTAGDVLRAAHFTRRVGQQGAGRDLLILTHAEVGLLRDIVHLEALTTLVLDDDLWVQITLVLHDDPAFGAGIVAFLAKRV